jgi:hypothetical protein
MLFLLRASANWRVRRQEDENRRVNPEWELELAFLCATMRITGGCKSYWVVAKTVALCNSSIGVVAHSKGACACMYVEVSKTEKGSFFGMSEASQLSRSCL